MFLLFFDVVNQSTLELIFFDGGVKVKVVSNKNFIKPLFLVVF